MQAVAQAYLFDACKDGDLEQVRQLLAKGANLEYTLPVSVCSGANVYSSALQGTHEALRSGEVPGHMRVRVRVCSSACGLG